MLRRTFRRDFFFTWQTEGFQKISEKFSYKSPVWVEQADIFWVSKTICPLKTIDAETEQKENPHQAREVPNRLSLFNLRQLNCTSRFVDPPLSASDCPPETKTHTSFSSKRAYDANMQFQLEQRVILRDLYPTDEQIEQENATAENNQRLPTEYFWITPKEAFNRRLRPNFAPNEDNGDGGKYEQPFAVLNKARKMAFNGDQFVDPKLFDKFPISAATARPMLIHQQSALKTWHEAHLETALTSEEEKNELYNRLCLFASKKEYEEMGLKLKNDASGVKVYVSKPPKEEGSSTDAAPTEESPIKEEKPAEQQQEAFGAALAQPRDSDLVHYSMVINQDLIWEKSRIVRPDDAAAATDEKRNHTVVPQGFDAFANMRPRLDEYLDQNPDLKGEKFWVTRQRVRELGLQLKEEAKWIGNPLKEEKAGRYKKSDSGSSGDNKRPPKDLMIELFHISQCEQPEKALESVGKHTR